MAMPQDMVPSLYRSDRPRRRPGRIRRDASIAFSAPVALRRWYADLRGQYRVANATEHRLYVEEDATPVPGVDTVRDSGTPPLTYAPGADGIYYAVLTYFNGFVESGYHHVDRIEIVSAAGVANPPSNPQEDWRLELRAGGVVRARALYNRLPDLGDSLDADQWKIWYTVNGVDPSLAGAADVTETMVFTGDTAELAYDLPAQANGTTVKVVVRTHRSAASRASVNTTVLSATADASGPAAPQDIEQWRGFPPPAL